MFNLFSQANALAASEDFRDLVLVEQKTLKELKETSPYKKVEDSTPGVLEEAAKIVNFTKSEV